MKTRITAAAVALAISVAVGACASKATPTNNPTGDSSAATNRDLPAEVRVFLNRRYECNHVITVERSQRLRCKELLTDEAALERQYSDNETVLRVLVKPLLQRLTAND